MEKRGEDLKNLRLGLLPILRLIAEGRLLPGIVVLYAGQPADMKRMAATMPLAEQEKIVAKGVVVEVAPPRPLNVPREIKPKATPRQEPERQLNVPPRTSHAKEVADMAAELIIGSESPDKTLRKMFRALLYVKRNELSAKGKRAVNAALVILAGP